MADELTSSLTAAKLKALCILNDLPTSGKKSDLVERLLDSGLSRDELGLSQVAEEVMAASIAEGEVILSLEDEETITPEKEPEGKKVEQAVQEDVLAVSYTHLTLPTKRIV